MVERFYKVECVDPNLTGQMGKFFFQNGKSLWLSERRARQALASVATPSQGPNAPFYAVMEFENQPGWPDEAISIVVHGKWEPPPDWRLVGDSPMPQPPAQEEVRRNPNLPPPKSSRQSKPKGRHP